MKKVVTGKKYNLEERLIAFAILIMEISENIFTTKAGTHLADQMIRSGSNPALHYGEAQSAESRRDFIHKIKILLKELRETKANLKIVKLKPLTKRIDLADKAIQECNELIAIFVTSVQTAKLNMEQETKIKILPNN